MTSVRIESAAEPFASRRALAQGAATLVSRGEVMGFLPVGTDTRVLDAHLLELLVTGLTDQGVSKHQLVHRRTWTEHDLEDVVARALEQSEHSPMPAGEWPSLTRILGEELLATLLGVSTTSVRRYGAGTRATQQDVAGRLHVLALLVADLVGGYNEYGIRRWFVRPRVQLDGKAPVTALGKGWDPEGTDALRLRGLAAGLVGSAAS